MNYKLSAKEAVGYIRNYYNETIKDANGRYLSWEYCYNAFCNSRGKGSDEIIDYLCLHLAFYLASWGMYRGSSFLLQKDYKVHRDIVETILDKKYDCLCGIKAATLVEDANLELVNELSKTIRNIYGNMQPSFENRKNNATDTLVTKIMLGTLGCAPAYDRYYNYSVKKYSISSARFNKASLENISKYYIENEIEFEEIRMEICSNGINYPQMKLMDMCMWEAAFEIDNKKE